MNLRKARNLEVFSMSFLDIISCGFGAIVVLILLFKPVADLGTGSVDEIRALLQQTGAAQRTVTQMKRTIADQERDNTAHRARVQALQAQLSERQGARARSLEQQETLESDIEGLVLVEQSLQRAAITPSSADERDEEVGGIPVDSDYVVFVIDTSGSMLQIWRRVAQTIEQVLDIHPQVKGFQILSDQGKAMIAGSQSRWIPDTPARRASILRRFRSWQSLSNSSPIEGIAAALRRYGRPGQSMSIYVFGDDYTGEPYELVLSKIRTLNRGPRGQRLAKIHGIGFISQHNTKRFPLIMRALTAEHGGTLLGLPR